MKTCMDWRSHPERDCIKPDLRLAWVCSFMTVSLNPCHLEVTPASIPILRTASEFRRVDSTNFMENPLTRLAASRGFRVAFSLIRAKTINSTAPPVATPPSMG